MALTRINNQALPTVDSDKLPAGTVLQVVRTAVDNDSQVAIESSSWTATGITASITPKRSDSLILVECVVSMADAESTWIATKMYMKVGTGSYTAMSGAGDYHIGYQASAQGRYGGFAFADKYTATSTDTITFQPYAKGSNSTRVRFAHAGSSAAITITEVAQ